VLPVGSGCYRPGPAGRTALRRGSGGPAPAGAAAITGPAPSDERGPLNAAGQVQLELKKPGRDGTKYLVMSPLEFMQFLAALVPRPRLRLKHCPRCGGQPRPGADRVDGRLSAELHSESADACGMLATPEYDHHACMGHQAAVVGTMNSIK